MNHLITLYGAYQIGTSQKQQNDAANPYMNAMNQNQAQTYAQYAMGVYQTPVVGPCVTCGGPLSMRRAGTSKCHYCGRQP